MFYRQGSVDQKGARHREDPMLEHADGSAMRISVKSLEVASASARVAELFHRNRFGCAACWHGG